MSVSIFTTPHDYPNHYGEDCNSGHWMGARLGTCSPLGLIGYGAQTAFENGKLGIDG